MTINFSEIPQKELAIGINGRYFHTINNTIGLVDIEEGSILPAHSHMHEQTTQIISGKLEMIIDGKKEILESGTITLIPSNVIHSAVALTHCVVMDTFYPVREDYK